MTVAGPAAQGFGRDQGSTNRPDLGAPGSFAERIQFTPRAAARCPGPVRWARAVRLRDKKTRRTSEAQLTTQIPAGSAPPGLPAELAGWPAYALDEAQLGDLELLTSGAFAPLRGFMGAADAASVAERGLLIDGTPWPVPVTFEVPADAIPSDARQVVLQDPEGSPLAVLSVTERRPVFELADRATVLRDGRAQGTVFVKEIDHSKLVQMIVGESAPPIEVPAAKVV